MRCTGDGGLTGATVGVLRLHGAMTSRPERCARVEADVRGLKGVGGGGGGVKWEGEWGGEEGGGGGRPLTP